MQNSKIIVIGGKGTSINIAESIKDASDNYNKPIELLGFCIDDPSLGDSINGIPILCKLPELNNQFGKYSDVKYIFTLYKPSRMKERVELLYAMNIPTEKYVTFIHPTSYIAPSSSIGIGNVILAHSCINSNVRIGNFNIFNQSVIIEHDTQIKKCNFFSAGAIVGSKVEIGDGNFFGIHSAIRENVNINDYNILGMGGVLLNSIFDGKTMIGVPAKELISQK